MKIKNDPTRIKVLQAEIYKGFVRNMDVEKHISETAFLVNESRARMVELSKDIYARLWVTERTKKIWEDFAKHVYPHDDLELSIRNRYFLEHLEKFVLIVEITDTTEQEKIYSRTSIMENYERILPTDFSILEKS